MTVAQLRRAIGVSRPALAHFLGISYPTMVRWELSEVVPRGLQLVLLREVERAVGRTGAARVRVLVRDEAALDHARAIHDLVELRGPVDLAT